MANDSKPRRVALVLQGGGALGAYQAGVYEGLVGHGCAPDWIAGTSIGAINGALIAGNTAEDQVPRLQEFWKLVSDAGLRTSPWPSGPLRQILSAWSIWKAITLGRPGFFAPRWFDPSVFFPVRSCQTASFYETAPLRATLERLVDFDLLNEGPIRLTVGAVNVAAGKLRYFDTKTDRLGPEHILASGALPPGLPAVRVDGELYWDGGIYSNTPLDVVLEDVPRVNTLCLMLSLFNPAGVEPRSISEVETRRKDITYATRIREHVAAYRRIENLRRTIRSLYALLPEDVKENPEVREWASLGCETTMHIVELLYPTRDWELAFKDADFSQAALEERWKLGLRDASLLGERRPWEDPVRPGTGVVVHTVESPADLESRDLAFR
ncbi:MAG: patatin-like phospholipase family protein [Deltaproteobacteria bacterium]|nr:patatin-like phospholipase family protein [Deltaproteobacteria bacterium]